ncbi:MAG: ADP-ribosyl-[dinitrogen reductase] hydrolase [Zoogloea sp.]|jgi:ADP-ribosyl-[dinitrogen reductase] hydrolase|uniref:ADP-ribosyl-[dinitrogen reductase] hydrolase n=1 Tax=Zoogloea sp. TaxID=49181 RepID=UPI00261D7AD7|nr:ADP-ribosyl-[dinitrogen reductase] hydrolase [Zoogloea sp.]MDD3327589.1 ADP-ribosyl-[dinitrogen reductase] hydrolase [Zoogloea sp.]
MLDALLLRRPSPVLPAGLAPGSLLDRALGAYLGLAIGDALGATVEFMTPREIAAKHGVHRHMSGGGWLKLAPGQVTDDTTMSLALGKAILEANGWCMRAVAEAFVAWLRGKPVDCGNTCRRGIRRYMADGSHAGPAGDGDAGNGAVMRNLPVVLATLHDEPAFEARSLAQAHFTHHNALSDAATLICGRLLRRLLHGGRLADCRPLADAFVATHPQFRFQPYPGRASGYVVDTLQTVFHFTFSEAGFEAALIGAVNRGDDADTTAALVGMLHGAQCGAGALPRQWLDKLDRDIAAAIVAQTTALLALAARQRR